ncbi:hypothetical protein BDV28DRAFT_144700 [Aspergillus coremiiformis]|uniref:BTB domain-containing protein n=1 Tax=Aspergillus coremiiformis TaxID=138285 RepID=A0A5N6ZH83_9EURO|nr:hypothetical protein BDV28DRAFT_144700 [Aspergillus coremiiformis]
MSSAEATKTLLDSSYTDFVKSCVNRPDHPRFITNVSHQSNLPLYHGPVVTINIGAASFEVSKTLLCKRSAYFEAMFNGNFKEGDDQSAEMEEVEGVVSVRSFHLLLQWLYLGRIVFNQEEGPEDRISVALEFTRLADMLGIGNGVESEIARHIKETILNNAPKTYVIFESHIHHITTQHFYAAIRLPEGHLVRLLFARAAIGTYLHTKDFAKDIQELPEFGIDLLKELSICLKTVTFERSSATFLDPFTGKRVTFRP